MVHKMNNISGNFERLASLTCRSLSSQHWAGCAGNHCKQKMHN
jgi:hypothetical protein